jgi:hypothetical protein
VPAQLPEETRVHPWVPLAHLDPHAESSQHQSRPFPQDPTSAARAHITRTEKPTRIVVPVSSRSPVTWTTHGVSLVPQDPSVNACAEGDESEEEGSEEGSDEEGESGDVGEAVGDDVGSVEDGSDVGVSVASAGASASDRQEEPEAGDAEADESSNPVATRDAQARRQHAKNGQENSHFTAPSPSRGDAAPGP